MKYIHILLFIFFSSMLVAEKVEITSDAMNAMNMQKEVHFIGNVKIKQSGNSLQGDKVIVYFDENNETKKYEAIGAVKFKFEKTKSSYSGSANKVIYYPMKSEYLLIGKAEIDDHINKRLVKGDEIILNLTTGNARVKGNKKKPVKFIFDMEKAK